MAPSPDPPPHAVTQFSFEQSAGFAKDAGFSSSGDPSPAGIIVAIAAAENGLQVDAGWYRLAAGITGRGANFGAYPSYRSGRYKEFVATADQVVKTGSAYSTPHIGAGDVLGAAGDVVTDPITAIGTGFGAVGGALASGLAPLKSLGDIAAMIAKAAAWVGDRHNWVRILEVALGAAGVLVGVMLIDRDLNESLKEALPLAALAAA